jgi:site-specific DNA-methyltransferase (adenine-specific)
MEINKKYNVIYADPPWSYDNKKIGRTNGNQPEGSGAHTKYSLMSLDQIKKMPIDNLTQENSLCFMWVTVPLLDDGMELLKAWGFEYKTLITWEKTGLLGLGHWVRIQTEHILIGVKGKVRPFQHQEKNVYRHRICEHSAKPHFFRELVMKLSSKSFGECNRLELFARSREGMFPDYEYEGWDVYGNQVNNSITI